MFKDEWTDHRTDQRTNKGDYFGPHWVTLGLKIEIITSHYKITIFDKVNKIIISGKNK